MTAAVSLMFVVVPAFAQNEPFQPYDNNASASKPGWTTYTSMSLGISFDYPVAWELKEGNDEIQPGPDVSVSNGNIEFRVNDFPNYLISKSWSLEELIKNTADSYTNILSRKIVEAPSLEHYIVGGEKTGSIASEHEDDNGKSLIDLELYADHGNQRYLFDFNSPKEKFSTDETKKIRQQIIDSIAFLDTEPAQGSSSRSNKISKDTASLPETLSMKTRYDFNVPIPLVAVINGGNVTMIKDKVPGKSTLTETVYNPLYEFQFREGSKTPLVNIKQILVGQVKPFSNFSEALESSYMYKNIAFNEKTVLPLKNGGFGYMIIEVQFVGNITGIYSLSFENTLKDSKSPTYSLKSVEQEAKINGWSVVNSSSMDIEPHDAFLSVAESVICHVNLFYGFQVCRD